MASAPCFYKGLFLGEMIIFNGASNARLVSIRLYTDKFKYGKALCFYKGLFVSDLLDNIKTSSYKLSPQFHDEIPNRGLVLIQVSFVAIKKAPACMIAGAQSRIMPRRFAFLKTFLPIGTKVFQKGCNSGCCLYSIRTPIGVACQLQR